MLSIFDSDFDLRSKAIASQRGYRLVAQVTDSEFWPALLGSDTALSLAADTFRREEPSYTDGANGFSPSLSHIFSPQLSARLGYVIRDHGEADFEFAYDSRDNPIMPTRFGNRIALQHKWSDEMLGSEVQFHRTRLTATTVLPMTNRSRVVLRGEAGVLLPKQDLDTVPIQERFFNGGEITVRSFREDQLAPDDLRDVNGRVIGGSYRNVFNAELRWDPRIRMFQAIDLELALFGDAGNLGRISDDYGLRGMKYAVGAGIRFLLPIGPVRFDYAHNPDREPGEREWTFHFSIGHAF
jgi:outer membrane translocation and assembly module TamA